MRRLVTWRCRTPGAAPSLRPKRAPATFGTTCSGMSRTRTSMGGNGRSRGGPSSGLDAEPFVTLLECGWSPRVHSAMPHRLLNWDPALASGGWVWRAEELRRWGRRVVLLFERLLPQKWLTQLCCGFCCPNLASSPAAKNGVENMSRVRAIAISRLMSDA